MTNLLSHLLLLLRLPAICLEFILGEIFACLTIFFNPAIEVVTVAVYCHTGPTDPSTDPTMPGTWQRSHWSIKFKSLE